MVSWKVAVKMVAAYAGLPTTSSAFMLRNYLLIFPMASPVYIDD